MTSSFSGPSQSSSASMSSMSSTSTSAPTAAVPSTLKRGIPSIPDLNFFTAAATFNPRPYVPHDRSTGSTKTLASRTHSIEAHANAPPAMDPAPDDIFLHPPFSSFPGSHDHPGGLTYAIMASNPQWFLDPRDFITTPASNINGIPYPSELEPPRGWCPSKKKEKSTAGLWPEGEEPRLRCTFCRRTYAGVNAKSMWRRHVFEKHKVAMINRRSDRPLPRGRGAANKENKEAQVLEESVEPETRDEQSSNAGNTSNTTSQLDSNANGDSSTRPHPLSQSTLPPISPPLTPDSPPPGEARPESTPRVEAPAVPPSPYDPLLTPSFRHSPARLPSDQPWRFPSPSHPLHSRTRELCLSMLAPTSSPAVKRMFVFNASPAGNSHLTPVQSPRTGSYNDLRVADLETPESLERAPRASPRSLFSQGRLPVPFPDKAHQGRPKVRVEQSPLARSSRGTLQSSDWSAGTGSLLPENDPFAQLLYNQWSSPIAHDRSSLQQSDSPPPSGPEGDSPVVRTALRSEAAGLGIGLLDPFTISSSTPARKTQEDRSSATPSPPLKKRRHNRDF